MSAGAPTVPTDRGAFFQDFVLRLASKNMKDAMDALTITFVTACSALVSAAAGPLVSIVVASRQIRASLISNNRERWIEALRDSVAEYVALAVSAAMLREVLRKDAVEAIRDDPPLAKLAERIALARNMILLMLNPAKEVP